MKSLSVLDSNGGQVDTVDVKLSWVDLWGASCYAQLSGQEQYVVASARQVNVADIPADEVLSADDKWQLLASDPDKGKQAVHEEVVAFLAGQRAGTACTKTRSHINGSGDKPWRQKGTGRARSGSRKSPIWRGGGVAFGPLPRDFSKKVNKKARRLALRRALAARLDEGAVIVVDDVQLSEPKTKLAVSFLDAIGAGDDALLLLENEENINVLLATQNLPHSAAMSVSMVNTYHLLLFGKIVITRAALDELVAKCEHDEEESIVSSSASAPTPVAAEAPVEEAAAEAPAEEAATEAPAEEAATEAPAEEAATEAPAEEAAAEAPAEEDKNAADAQ